MYIYIHIVWIVLSVLINCHSACVVLYLRLQVAYVICLFGVVARMLFNVLAFACVCHPIGWDWQDLGVFS